jgi:hypothetical protein
MFDCSIYIVFVLNRAWKRVSLQIMLFGYVCSTWGIVELKIRFESLITRIEINGVSLCYLPFLITLMVYLCSKRTPNVQMMYFMFDLSIYSIFVLNRSWKRESPNNVIRIVYSTWGIVELKTRFETRIRSDDVYGVSLYNLSHLITLIAYLCSEKSPNVQINCFMFDCSIYKLFVLNTSRKRDSLQMIFENDCWTWSMVELKTRFVTWITSNDVRGVIFFTFLI